MLELCSPWQKSNPRFNREKVRFNRDEYKFNGINQDYYIIIYIPINIIIYMIIIYIYILYKYYIYIYQFSGMFCPNCEAA